MHGAQVCDLAAARFFAKAVGSVEAADLQIGGGEMFQAFGIFQRRRFRTL
jgi:hypothetical protein